LELDHLRAEEEKVRNEIETALQKENLDRELSLVGDTAENGGTYGDVKSSPALLGDLEEIRAKVDRFQVRRNLDDFPVVKESGEAVVSCYKLNSSSPLDCWREVVNFRASVAQAETQYLASLQ